MTKIDNAILSAISAIVLFIAVGLIFSVSVRSEARKNRVKVLELLAGAHSVQAQGPTGTAHVMLGDGTVLVPGRDQSIAGYVFKLHIQSTNFTLLAEPLRWGETGTISFFRDEAGVLRFDPSGRNANEGSRPWPTPY